MKRIISYTGVLSVILLAACSESTSDAETNVDIQNDNTNDEKIEIEYWYAFGDKIGENNENLVDQFNESQNEIQVNAHYQGDYADLHAGTQAAAAAGNPPHVTLNEIASVGTFARSGMTQDMTSYVERDGVDMDDFVDGLMGNSYVDEGLYGLPYLRSTPILYVNATMLEEAGLDPSGPSNWEEFADFSRVLTDDDTVGMTFPIGIWIYEGLVAQSGGSVLSEDELEPLFNEAPGVEAVEFLMGLEEEGVIKIPTGDESGQVAGQDFANQNSAMIFGSTAGLTNYLEIAEGNGFEINTTFMPANVDYGVPTGGANLVMIADHPDEEKEAAWEFIKWMTDTEQTIYASTFTGYLPSRHSAVESDEMNELYEEIPQYKVAVDQLEYARHRPMNTGYPEVMSMIEDAIATAILDDNVSAQEALDDAAERAKELLD
ncbi:ABC transporter substrate-binding protein [Salipaludibacillus sp. HK11]|uniref:ABC transporter substrate-binding protein n=1 Tax=Salipaludibacillus sp. HK11 TaxID=3394320 RepID=UPI0039FD8600